MKKYLIVVIGLLVIVSTLFTGCNTNMSPGVELTPSVGATPTEKPYPDTVLADLDKMYRYLESFRQHYTPIVKTDGFEGTETDQETAIKIAADYYEKHGSEYLIVEAFYPKWIFSDDEYDVWVVVYVTVPDWPEGGFNWCIVVDKETGEVLKFFPG